MRRTRLPRKAILTSGFADLYHVDAYRLREGDNKDIHLAELFLEPGNLVLIEWPERVKTLLPRHTIKLRFFHGRNENERVLTLPAIS
jgi:tRNA A37 threonylcarbamoyladenosine biosynthesis protein TsaE